jgi:hypothetical protein
MKTNALTGSGRSPWRRRLRLFQEVPLHPQGLDLGPQMAQLLTLGRAQPLLIRAAVGVGLTDPLAQQLIRDPQLGRDSSLRLPRRSPQLNGVGPVLGRILVWRCHRNILRGAHAPVVDVHRTGSTPLGQVRQPCPGTRHAAWLALCRNRLLGVKDCLGGWLPGCRRAAQ